MRAKRWSPRSPQARACSPGAGSPACTAHRCPVAPISATTRHRHRVLRRRSRPRAAVLGEGQRRRRRQGHRDRSGRREEARAAGDKTWCAKVKVEINDSVHLPNNATAEIAQTSLLGEKYVSLNQPVGKASPAQLKTGVGDQARSHALRRGGRGSPRRAVTAVERGRPAPDQGDRRRAEPGPQGQRAGRP